MSRVKLGPQTLLYPMPAVLVGSIVGGKPNFMTAAWCGIACRKPPAVCVAIETARYTLEGIRETGTFSVNVPSADLAKKVDYCGLHSGRKEDKSGIFEVTYGELGTAPLVEECPVSLECRRLESMPIGTHELVVGEIVQTHVREDCLIEGKPDPSKIDPLIFVPGTRRYHRLGEEVAKAFHVGKERP